MSLIVTLDGPSGSGKSTAALEIAKHFQIPCLDTGAMYRSLAHRALLNQIDLSDEDELRQFASRLRFQFSFEGDRPAVDLSFDQKPFERVGPEIRTPQVSMAASELARFAKVRAVLVQQQQEIGQEQGAVVEGRDAGTVIFPHAPIKFFVTASVEERARRRHLELIDRLKDQSPSYDEVLKEMVIRDHQDSERAASPLRPAEDAVFFDTTGLHFGGVVSFMIDQIESKLHKRRFS